MKGVEGEGDAATGGCETDGEALGEARDGEALAEREAVELGDGTPARDCVPLGETAPPEALREADTLTVLLREAPAEGEALLLLQFTILGSTTETVPAPSSEK
jgi:hypothetical protein